MVRFAIALSLIVCLVVAIGIGLGGQGVEDSRRSNADEILAEYDGPAPELIDHARDLWPGDLPPPRSAWVDKERQAFQQILTEGQFDVLVLPFQVVESGVSRSVRSLMGAELALAISELGERVADPYQTARVLGEGLRRFDQTSVRRLAGDLAVRQVVQGYVGHDQHNKLKLVVRVTELTDPSRWRSNNALHVRELTLREIPFSYERPALTMFDQRLPRIMEFLGYSWSGWEPRASGELAGLPAIVSGHEDNDLLASAVRFQMFGTLTPARMDRAREIFYEKSILATQLVRAPEASALRARGLLKLGMRPAALAMLEDPRTPLEEAVAAAANGNLTDLMEALPTLKRPYERFLVTFDISELEVAYGLYTKEDSLARVEALSLPEPWVLVAERRAIDGDGWSLPTNLDVKSELDRAYPILGFDLETLAAKSALVGPLSSSMNAAEFYAEQHAERLRKTRSDLWCCASFSAADRPADYLDLLLAVSTDNLLRRASFYTFIQGQPDQALRFLDGAKQHFYQHPDFAYERSLALFRKAEQLQAEQDSALWSEAGDSARLAFYWEQGQTYPAPGALDLMDRTPTTLRGLSRRIDAMYTGDLPYAEGWPLRRTSRPLGPREVDMIARRLAYTVWDTDTLERDYELEKKRGNDATADRIRVALTERFAGNPGKYLWLASMSEASGDTEASFDHLRKGIESLPRYWPLYQRLSTALAQHGDLEAADELLRSYPPFEDGDEQRVALSNQAYEAGSLFYWRGMRDAASYYYRISASLQTGSEGSIASGTRLALAQDEYIAAIQGSLRRGNRYHSSYAFRDYIGLLFLLGEQKEAWSSFDALNAQFAQVPHLWEAVLSGHRIGNFSEVELLAWAEQFDGGDLATKNKVSRYLARTAIMDRIPSERMIEAIEQREGPHWIPKDSIKPAHILDPRARPAMSQLWPDISPQDQVSVRPALVYLLEGYRASQQGRFEAAFGHFDDLFRLYRGQLNQNLGIAVPYYVLTGLKAGKMEEVDAVLGLLGERNETFDYWLAIALRSGLDGRHDDSMNALRRAMGVRPYTEYRIVFPEYEYADVCDWLWRETGREEFRARALAWVRSNQKTQPWQSWPYTFEIALSASKPEHLLLEKAAFLDPQSPRLPARAFANGNNPFLEHAKQHELANATRPDNA